MISVIRISWIASFLQCYLCTSHKPSLKSHSIFLFTSAFSLVTKDADVKNAKSAEKKQKFVKVNRKPTIRDDKAPLKFRDFFLYPRLVINKGIIKATARRTVTEMLIISLYSMLLADNYEISVQDNEDMVLPGTSIVNCSLKTKLHVTLVATWLGMHVKRKCRNRSVVSNSLV